MQSAARTQIPEVNSVAIFIAEQILGNDAFLELRWQRPFARYHVVAWQVPPEIVVLVLRSPVHLPAAEHIERLAVHDEDSWRADCPVWPTTADRGDIDAFRPTMDRVGPGIARLAEYLLRLDDLVDLCLCGVRLGVDHVNS